MAESTPSSASASVSPPSSMSDAGGSAVNYNPAWRELVSDFHQGGLTPAQYAAFALAGIFLLLLLITTIIAIHSTRRANAIEAESAMAAIGRWKDAERDIVKSVPEPPRLHKVGGGGGGGGGGGRRVLAHMRRFSEDRMPVRRDRERERARSRSMDKGRS